jgi:hypothetical protein
LRHLHQQAAADAEYPAILEVIRHDKHPKQLPPQHPARGLHDAWPYLSISGDAKLVVYDGCRIFIPANARGDILRQLHVPHAGVTKTRVLAQQLYWWPGMNKDISDMINECDLCQVGRPSQSAEPLLLIEAQEPNEQWSVDIGHSPGGNHNYLIVVDRYSGFPWVKELRSLDTGRVVTAIKSIMHFVGRCQKIRTDGGGQFRSEFDTFCLEWGLEHAPSDTSSPYHHQSNGLAEVTVHSMKELLRKSNYNFDTFQRALLEWRNVPRADGFSPAQMYLGRKQRTLLPALPVAYQPIDQARAAKARRETRDKAKEYHDQTAHLLPALMVGQHVRLQHPITKLWDSKGVVHDVRDTGRSYNIKLYNGTFCVRNRIFLKPITNIPTENSDDSFSASNHHQVMLPAQPRRRGRPCKKEGTKRQPVLPTRRSERLQAKREN